MKWLTVYKSVPMNSYRAECIYIQTIFLNAKIGYDGGYIVF